MMILWHHPPPAFLEVSNYSSSTFVSAKGLEKLDSYKYKDEEEIVLIVTTNVDNILADVIDKFPRINKYKVLNKCNSYTTYCLYE